MLNQIYVDKLISLIKQGLLIEDDIKNADYKNAVHNVLNPI